MKYARPNTQTPLLDVAPAYVMTNAGQTRVAYGNAAQEIVCRALALDPIPITGEAEVCFDARGHGCGRLGCPCVEEWHYEIKSVKRNGKIPVYDFRLNKERAAEEEGKRLRYAVLEHDGHGETDPARLFGRMLAHARILIVPARLVRAYAFGEPLRLPKPPIPGTRPNGYNRAGYADGYRNLPVRALAGDAMDGGQLTFREFELFGLPCRIQVWTL